jgi:opacity protein-like surface antigen
MIKTLGYAGRVSVVMAVALMAPAIASAQDQRLRISFTTAAATVSDDTELALGGSFGYRFAERLWFEGEVTWIDGAGGSLDRDFDFERRSVNASSLTELLPGRFVTFVPGLTPGSFTQPMPGLPPGIPDLRLSSTGSTTLALLGVRYELPVQTERFRPYASGGLGLNFTEQELRLEGTTIGPGFDESRSHTGFAFGAGAGASVRVFSQLWADMEARYYRLSRDRDVMRLGGGVSFRF